MWTTLLPGKAESGNVTLMTMEMKMKGKDKQSVEPGRPNILLLRWH